MDSQEDQYQFQDRDAMNRIEGAGNGGDNVAENDDETIDYGAEESSIFGQTTGSSNATWVECDKCQKVSQTPLLFFLFGTFPAMILILSIAIYFFRTVATIARRSRYKETPIEMVLCHEQGRPRA